MFCWGRGSALRGVWCWGECDGLWSYKCWLGSRSTGVDYLTSLTSGLSSLTNDSHMKVCWEPSRFQRLGTQHNAWHTHLVMPVGAGLFQAQEFSGPGATAHPPWSLYLSWGTEKHMDPVCQRACCGGGVGCQSPVEKALGWEPKSAPCMFHVLWQVTTPPPPGLHFLNSLIKRSSPWSPAVLPAWMFCDSVPLGLRGAPWCVIGWGGMDRDGERGRDRASAKRGLSPTFPD